MTSGYKENVIAAKRKAHGSQDSKWRCASQQHLSSLSTHFSFVSPFILTSLAFFPHPSTSDPLISLAIYHHLKAENICLNIQRNMRRNNMTLEDNYGERFHMCGNLYTQFSVVRQNVMEKRIIYSSLSLYVSSNLCTTGKKKFLVVLKGSEVDENM